MSFSNGDQPGLSSMKGGKSAVAFGSVTSTSPMGLPAKALVTGTIAFALLPIISLVIIAVGADLSVWPHLLRHVLPRAIWDTVILSLGVAFGTAVLGLGSAWLTTMYRFPGRRIFSWALVLPLAVPTYIAAYTQVEFWDYSGPVQGFIRDVMGVTSRRDYYFFDIRSLWGASTVLSLVLYPYVYLPCRLVFSMQGASILDASRSLGAGPWKQFRRVAIPIARPALAAGIALALMEVMNDIGAVEALGVKTLPYAVFETWLNRDNLGGAVQLALLTLLVIAGLIYVERWARRHRSYASRSGDREPAFHRLTPAKATASTVFCSLILFGGLGVPLAVLLPYTLRRLDTITSPVLWSAFTSSLTVAVLSGLLATVLAFALLQTARITRNPGIATFGRLAGLGYGIPGIVLAVGLLIPLAAFDNGLDAFLRSTLGVSSGLLISGSVAILVYACTLRFFALTYGTLEAGFSRISPSIDMASRALGRDGWKTAMQVHRPIMNPVIAVGFILVFVDSMKELSATLLLRPFGFETLATLIYDQASQAALEEGAMASLLIVATGLVSTALLFRLSQHR